MLPSILLFGPVPPRGAGKLPGIVVCSLGLLGLLRLPFDIRKYGVTRLGFAIAIDAAFLIGGIVMLAIE